MDQDAAIVKTAEDAARGKLGAVSRGYFADPFAALFAPSSRAGDTPLPVINRGNFARVEAVERVVRSFLEGENGPKQVVSLGAGKDTLYFRLLARGEETSSLLGFFEVDLPSVVKSKLAILRRSPELSGVLDESTPLSEGGASFPLRKYHLLSADLREPAKVIRTLKAAGVRVCDTNVSTLILVECVLVYLPVPSSSALLQELSNSFPRSTIVNYEMIKPDDAFGRVMISNLRSRGCELPGCFAFPSLASQAERFRAAGWQSVSAKDMLDVYENVLDRSKVAAAEKCEALDEVEEWQLIMRHYAFVVAAKNPGMPTNFLLPQSL
jgi:O-methyltransferase involved in polyketide biosynthesis